MKKGKKGTTKAAALAELAQLKEDQETAGEDRKPFRETAEDASWVMLETKWKLAPAIFTLESAANGMSLEANITLDGNCKVRFYDVLEGVAVMLRDCQVQLDKAYERINP